MHDPSVDPLEARRLFSAVQEADRLAAGSFFDPDQVVLTRDLTPAEKAWLAANPAGSTNTRIPSAPPTGPVDPVAEYDPMDGLVISWGTTGSWPAAWRSNLAQIARRVTVEGNSRMYVGVTGVTAQNDASNQLLAAGANLANVTFFTVPLNSIWARDYGPRYVFEGDVRVITDHRYNRPTRTSDDNQPVVFGQFKKHQYYEIGLGGTTLVHGGGNYHLATNGDAYATQLIVNENPTLTAAQIQQIWSTYQNNNVTLTQPFPTSVDATQHIDMWMQIYDDDKVFISDWPSNPGSTQDQICDNTAVLMQSRGYQVTRIPAYSIGGVHYTFANMVICNNVVLLPQYNNGQGATVSSQVLSTVQAAFGAARTVYPINADSIVTAAGVFHCIVQHVPAHRGLAGPNGGLAPTAHLRGPNNGPVFASGSSVNLQWLTDDDAPVAATAGVQGVDLLLSTDGGATFSVTLASNQPALGAFNWSIPAGISTTEARIRVVARDALGNTGFDDTDINFTIDTVAPAVTGGAFEFEQEQRVDLALSETAALGAGVTLTNLTTGDVLTGGQLALSGSGATATVAAASGLLADGNWRTSVPAGALTDTVGNPSTAAGSFDFFVLAGDANRDRSVDIADFSTLAANFNARGTFSQGDFDYTGRVEIGDFALLASRFNTSLPAARHHPDAGVFPPAVYPSAPGTTPFAARPLDRELDELFT